MDTSERKYTAFISYRHKPLDIAVAEELINLIEHYRIPKDLRKDGSTSLGLVFRDRDELGVHHDLAEAIYPALDHSDYLIVICTPDTKDSEWIPLEIAHFLKNHSRDKILVVHAAGSAQEAIPKQITHVYDENGNLTSQITPLSIYLVDSNQKKVLSNLNKQFLHIAAFLLNDSYESLLRRAEYRSPRKLLKREFLRLAAALLGCPYDELIQRNKRYLYQRLMIFSILVAFFLLIFALVVIDKNMHISDMNLQIQEHLRQTQINESEALASVSRIQLSTYDRLGSIKSAIAALPSEGNERPYSASAHAALAESLYVYADEKYRLEANYKQYEDLRLLNFSDDGRYMITASYHFSSSSSAQIQCYDLDSHQILWDYVFTGCEELIDIIFADNVLYVTCPEYMHVFDLLTGEKLSQYPHFSHQVSIFLESQILVGIQEETDTRGYPDILRFFDLKTGKNLGTIHAEYNISPDNTRDVHAGLNYANALSSHAVSAEGSVYVTLNPQRIVMIDLEKHRILHTIELATYDFKNAIVIPLAEGGFLISYHELNVVRVCHLGMDGELTTLGTIDTTDIIAIPKGLMYSLENIYLVDHFIYFLYADFYHWMDLTTGDWAKVDYSWYGIEDSLVTSCATEDGLLWLLFPHGQIATIKNSEYAPNPQSRNELSYVGPALEHQFTLDYRAELSRAKMYGSSVGVAVMDEHDILIYRLTGGTDYEVPTVLQNNCSNDYCRFSVSGKPCVVSASGNRIMTDYSHTVTDGESKHRVRHFGPVFDLNQNKTSDTVFSVSEGESTVIDGMAFDLADDGQVIGFTEDETSVILNDCILLNISTGELSLFEHYTEFMCCYPETVPYENGLLTVALGGDLQELHWWRDGSSHATTPIPLAADEQRTVPFPGSNGLVTLGHMDSNGSLISILCYSIADDLWKEYVLDCDYDSLIAPSGKKELIFLDADSLSIYDFDTNSIIREIPSPVPANRIKGMESIRNGQQLLIVADDWLFVMDTGNGNILAEFSLEFIGKTDHLLLSADEEKNLLFVHEQVIDMETWAVLYEIPNMIAYLPEVNSVLCKDEDELVIRALYSIDDLIAFGNTIIHGR